MIKDKNIILSEFIGGKGDPQRLNVEPPQLNEYAQALVKSTMRFTTPVYVVTDLEEKSNQAGLHIVTMPLPEDFDELSMYYQRWILAFHFIQAHPEIEHVVLVDLNDVEMLHDPFDDLDPDKLYIGDEVNDLTMSYIVDDDQQPLEMRNFFSEHFNFQLLNPGVILGSRKIILEFLGIMANLFLQDFRDHVYKGRYLFPFDMGLVNYVAYRYFYNRLVHGRQVSTVFKFLETQSGAWFKHK
ncbi:hypothetical protein IV38_GL001916 [Lactobacillus selangorensis]|uniref:Uncharacterized protein n=1 Tax=Lactobacillus selangorensis TaxID=81857 RepID=A0A0R2FQQ8_9LACO|nr:hypothetical protein [Lactobacillus selangorensis]KRN27703.1 hypothetical protein IV38_GL001916 [Lactobacillus selangorensis]KRN30332.1 hypothetical protein IV40_GL001921 [Lactobacillus selangorensis]